MAFVKQISFGSCPINLETLSVDKSNVFNSSESCPVHISWSVIYLSIEICCCLPFYLGPLVSVPAYLCFGCCIDMVVCCI